MKNTIIILFISYAFFSSCKLNKSTVSSTTPTNESAISYSAIFNPATQNLNRDWTLLGVDSYKVMSAKDDLPILDPGDIIWSFRQNERGPDSLYIMAFKDINIPQSKFSDYKFQYWDESCLLEFDGKKYRFEIFEIHDNEGNIVAHDLTLIDNLSMNIADAGATLRFRSTDAFWACGTTSKGENKRPQWAPLINGIVAQANIPEEELSGRYTLVSYSAFTSIEYLPSYKEQEVIWEFDKQNYAQTLTVKKTNTEIKNDYSLSEGKYSFWSNQCLLQIGEQLYYYQLEEQKDVNGNSNMILHLNSGLEPSIADEEQHFYFKKI